MNTQRPALGRGLAALIPTPQFKNLNDDYFMCELGSITADPNQPRQRFDDDALDDLVKSIKETGILQPIVVRRSDADDVDHYIIVAGERRYRAAGRAGLSHIPVLLKDIASEEALEIALVENIQREDLDPIEEALAYKRLLDSRAYTQTILARRLGKNRSTITNTLRLLKLTPAEQNAVVAGEITSGHARCLLAITDPEQRTELLRRIIDGALSVRSAETEARALKSAARVPRPHDKKDHPLQPYCDAVANNLSEHYGTRVQVTTRGRRGRIVLHFHTPEALRTLAAQLLTDNNSP